jgi:hypothetical protein
MLAIAQVNSCSLFSMPLDGAAALRKDLVEEGSAGDDAAGFTPEGSDTGTVTDNEAGVIERRRILS